MLPIEQLIITQHGLQNQEKIPLIIKYVQRGGIFDKKSFSSFCFAYDIPCSEQICISCMPDKKLFLHSGHLRAYSILKAGRTWLEDKEFVIKKLTYADYQEINVDIGFLTPFDVRKEVRISSFLKYKEEALDCLDFMEKERADDKEIMTMVELMAEERKEEYKIMRVHKKVSDILLPIKPDNVANNPVSVNIA